MKRSIMKNIIVILILMIAHVTGCTQSSSKPSRVVVTGCEGCELMFDGMPENLSWKYNIAEPDEPGQAMIISGVIYKRDGKTPAPGIILYVYHTDHKGNYSPAHNQTDAKRHGHLRGWIKTDASGRYEFKTIRPASYPNSNIAQHIHPIILESGNKMYWIDEFLFDDDPMLTTRERTQQRKRGGSGIVTLSKNEKGIWLGKRDIILGLNIPNY